MNRVLAEVYRFFLSYAKIFSRRNFNKYIRYSTQKYVKKSSKTILSFGSGGQVKSLLDKMDLGFTEIDIDPARKPDLIQDIQHMKGIKSNSVDVIYCLEVLEHVQNPLRAVSEMKRVLKKGGIVIASTPFVFPIHDEPYDFYRYTKYGIRELFKEFKELELWERNSFMASVYVVMIRAMCIGSVKQRMLGVLLFPLYVVFLPLFWLMSLIIPHYHATTGYVYVFKKK